jgi:hypothetical protein
MTFNQEERTLFGRLADELIPAGDEMPAASAAGVTGQWLDAVLAARPDLESGLKAVLQKALDWPAAASAVEYLRSNDPEAFGILSEISAAAYFMNPEVQRAIGYIGQNPQPIDPRPDYLDDDLLQAVVGRGPIYRPTPPT